MTLCRLATVIFIGLSVLPSCSSIKSGLATAKNATTQTAQTIANATTQAFRDEDQLQLTKANPSRFLPQNVDADEVRKNPVIARREQKQRLLAKNERQLAYSAASDVPLSELPPLPVFDTEQSEDYAGILPALESNSEPTTSDVAGETPTPPPLAEGSEQLSEQ